MLVAVVEPPIALFPRFRNKFTYLFWGFNSEIDKLTLENDKLMVIQLR
jgi:hypothetical protein